MTEMSQVSDNGQNWKTQALVVGALIGALVGVGGAYLLIQNAEKHGDRVDVSSSEGIKISLLVMGLLRQIDQLGEKE